MRKKFIYESGECSFCGGFSNRLEMDKHSGCWRAYFVHLWKTVIKPKFDSRGNAQKPADSRGD